MPPTKPNINTLNGLSQYAGFRSFYAFSNQLTFPNFDSWLYVLRCKQQEKITEENIQFIQSKLSHEYFVFYFIDIVTHFMTQKNKVVCVKLFEIKLDSLEKSEQLRIAVALGVILRHSYKDDREFIFSLLDSPQFRRVVVYNFIDYSHFNAGYMELIKRSIQLETGDDHLLFLHLLSSYHSFLNGQVINDLGSFGQLDFSVMHPIVHGRYYAYKLYSAPASKRTAVFDKLLVKSEDLDKCEFFFEIIPTILLLNRLDWVERIYNSYYEEIFEVNEFNQITHLSIYQIALTFLSIKEGHLDRARSELEKVNFDLALDSYTDYIKLFSFIASYHLEKDKEAVKEEYTQLAEKLGFKVFILDLLETYFV